MKFESNNYEYKSDYDDIVKDILKNREFQKIERCNHHKTNRLEHSKRVSRLSYKICKKFNLDYIAAARGGLLHDFFTNRYTEKNSTKLMKNHPSIAVRNAKKHFKINEKEKNIIESHMYPLNINKRPKYIESFIVSSVDKLACIYEKSAGYTSLINFKLGKAAIYMFIFLFS